MVAKDKTCKVMAKRGIDGPIPLSLQRLPLSLQRNNLFEHKYFNTIHFSSLNTPLIRPSEIYQLHIQPSEFDDPEEFYIQNCEIFQIFLIL